MKEKGNDLIIFENNNIRRYYKKDEEEWYYSVLDVIAVLTDSTNPRNYWKVLKHRLKQEDSELVTNCNRFKLRAKDGKMRKTDCVTEEQLFRLIQSIPSPKVELFKQWLAKVGTERLEEERNPSKAVHRAINTYRKQGRSDEWTKLRLESIDERNTFTDAIEPAIDDPTWQYGKATNTCYKGWSGYNTNEYKKFKGIKQKDSLRDNMSRQELTVTSLVEQAVVKAVENHNVKSYDKLENICHRAGKIGKNVCDEIEALTGEPVVTAKNNLSLNGGGNRYVR